MSHDGIVRERGDELAEQVNRVSALINICKDKLHKTEEEVEKILKDMNQ